MRKKTTASSPVAYGAVDKGTVVVKAVLNAARRLAIPNKVLARIVGVSEASASRMATGAFALSPTDKAFEIGVLFVRLYRSLDAIVGGDEAVARAWLRNDNAALGAPPLERIQTISGLVDVIAYLDARRALL